jgi:hypothetical protein
MNRFTAFFLGMREFRRSFTWADPARVDGPTLLDETYDLGRDFAHRITFRAFEA